MRNLPTIKAAKGYCKARYGRLPRCGYEMECIRYQEFWPGRGVPGYMVECRVYLVNTSGRYEVREYCTSAS